MPTRLTKLCHNLPCMASVRSWPDGSSAKAPKCVLSMKVASEFISVGTAATELGRSTQTMRNWLDKGRLVGRRRANNDWEVKQDSVDAAVAQFGRKDASISRLADLSAEVRRLAEVVDEIQRDKTNPSESLGAVAKERDRYRAEAATMRAAARSLNAGAQDVNGAVRQLLSVLERQSDAITSLLGPPSPEELVGD